MALLFIPLASLIAYLVFFWMRWKKLKLKLFQDQPEGDQALAPGVLHRHLSSSAWPRGIEDALSRFASELGKLEGAAARKCSQVLGNLQPAQRKLLIEKSRDAARSALQEGELASFLCKSGEDGIYALVFPVLHLQPQTLRRYDGFQRGIVAHLDRIYELAAATTPAVAMVTLLFLIRPDADEVVLLLGFSHRELRLYPDALLDEHELRAIAQRTTRERHEFTLRAA